MENTSILMLLRLALTATCLRVRHDAKVVFDQSDDAKVVFDQAAEVEKIMNFSETTSTYHDRRIELFRRHDIKDLVIYEKVTYFQLKGEPEVYHTLRKRLEEGRAELLREDNFYDRRKPIPNVLTPKLAVPFMLADNRKNTKDQEPVATILYKPAKASPHCSDGSYTATLEIKMQSPNCDFLFCMSKKTKEWETSKKSSKNGSYAVKDLCLEVWKKNNSKNEIDLAPPPNTPDVCYTGRMYTQSVDHRESLSVACKKEEDAISFIDRLVRKVEDSTSDCEGVSRHLYVFLKFMPKVKFPMLLSRERILPRHIKEVDKVFERLKKGEHSADIKEVDKVCERLKKEPVEMKAEDFVKQRSPIPGVPFVLPIRQFESGEGPTSPPEWETMVRDAKKPNGVLIAVITYTPGKAHPDMMSIFKLWHQSVCTSWYIHKKHLQDYDEKVW